MGDWFLILAGFVLLIGSAEFLVRGSVWCALALGVSPMTVGLSLVAFGTSAPELFVSFTAALQDAPGIATGNALGSNLANIGLILGVTAVVRPIDHTPRSARFEVGFLLLVSALILIPILLGEIDRVGGALLLVMLALFTGQLIRRETRRRADRQRAKDEEDDPTSHVPAHIRRGVGPAMLNIVFVIGGLVGLKFGGDVLVGGATNVARDLGMSEFLIGQTVIAIGTSLPELATSAVAARRGHPELALGNVLGSNIFNLCMVLGATAVVVPLPVSRAIEGPTALLGLLMAVGLAILLRYRGGVGRLGGTVFLLVWLGYVATMVARG